MKISIKNFGPIEHFEFDLEKDLHVIYGENNIGKSWAINLIYLVLKSYERFIESDDFEFNVKTSYVNEVKENIFDLMQIEDINKLVLNNYLVELCEKNLNIFTEFLHSSLKNTFSNIVNTQTKLKPEIEIKTDYFSFDFCFEDKAIKKLHFSIDKDIHFDYDLKEEDDDFIELIRDFFSNNKKKTKNKKLIDEIKEEIIDQLSFEIGFRGVQLFKNLAPDALFDLYFLPSSREGLHHQFSNFGNILAELSRFRFQIKSQFKIPKLSEPIADYLKNLSQVDDKVINKGLLHIVNSIESEILKAKIKFDKKKSEIKFIDNRTKIQLDILEASSMISELAPLVIFMRHIISVKKRHSKYKFYRVLFIEEPEAHLHPKVQVEMMKIFVDLAKSGVKVVMTTHSDFMMNELTNLLLEKKIDADKVGSYHLVMGEKGSYDAGDMKATSEGIEDYNFTDVAVEQYERRMSILEKLNQEHAFTEDSAR
ncbi:MULTISPECIES: AAA family ATPase [Emticicia]|uniref:AAA family ATPase n=1 Tax=Emticicia TaxID=312278 RepID=UPI0007D8AFF9|nr:MULTISPECIES: AAA family ATPase [Emticicia]